MTSNMSFKKIFYPFLIVILPLIVFNDLSSQVMFPNALLKSIVVTITLIILLKVAANKYVPAVALKYDVKPIAWAFFAGFLFFAINFIGVLLTSNGEYSRMTIIPVLMIPGYTFFPAFAVLCIGLIELIKDYTKSEVSIIAVSLVGIIIFTLLSQINFYPLSFLFHKPENMFGLSFPLISVDSNFLSWPSLLAKVNLLLMCLVYNRLGAIPAITFAVSYSVFNYLLVFNGILLLPDIHQWISFLIVFIFLLKFTKKTT